MHSMMCFKLSLSWLFSFFLSSSKLALSLSEFKADNYLIKSLLLISILKLVINSVFFKTFLKLKVSKNLGNRKMTTNTKYLGFMPQRVKFQDSSFSIHDKSIDLNFLLIWGKIMQWMYCFCLSVYAEFLAAWKADFQMFSVSLLLWIKTYKFYIISHQEQK